jgi:c-di-GMP-binding flagellar brake protein YcgR
MDSIVGLEQVLSVIPDDFRNANKGKVVSFDEKGFSLELLHAPTGMILNSKTEFYSKTQNGMLYFDSVLEKVDGKIITVKNPIKHRYLKRRQFTRIKYNEDLEFSDGNQTHAVSAIDLSAGGMKLKCKDCLGLENIYKVNIPLSNEIVVNSEFHPIRIEKRDDGYYTLSGRFQNQSNIDKMSLIQFCINKNLEKVNK